MNSPWVPAGPLGGPLGGPGNHPGPVPVGAAGRPTSPSLWGGGFPRPRSDGKGPEGQGCAQRPGLGTSRGPDSGPLGSAARPPGPRGGLKPAASVLSLCPAPGGSRPPTNNPPNTPTTRPHLAGGTGRQRHVSSSSPSTPQEAANLGLVGTPGHPPIPPPVQGPPHGTQRAWEYGAGLVGHVGCQGRECISRVRRGSWEQRGGRGHQGGSGCRRQVPRRAGSRQSGPEPEPLRSRRTCIRRFPWDQPPREGGAPGEVELQRGGDAASAHTPHPQIPSNPTGLGHGPQQPSLHSLPGCWHPFLAGHLWDP